ncbi:MAG TPA: PA2779 family protein [Burkholderiaceae bacterium]|jgi:hypothetical protein|nr:PA2779 family protein [Burkholderiaceae bacterium]
MTPSHRCRKGRLARRMWPSLLAASLTWTAGTLPALATTAPITAATLAAESETASSARPGERLQALLQRDEVRQALIERGVNPADAAQRVASLTDDQADQLLAEIDSAPAGAGIIETAVFVFLVLLVTDILGFTKVFSFTRSIR